MRIQRYISRLRRMLYVNEARKDEIIGEILNKIREKQLAGQSDKDILNQLRPASEIAREENKKANIQYRKSPWRWACLALSILCILLFALQHGWIPMSIPSNVGIIGGADGPTAILVSSGDASIPQNTYIPLLLAAMGLVGFFALSKCPVEGPKESEE